MLDGQEKKKRTYILRAETIVSLWIARHRQEIDVRRFPSVQYILLVSTMTVLVTCFFLLFFLFFFLFFVDWINSSRMQNA